MAQQRDGDWALLQSRSSGDAGGEAARGENRGRARLPYLPLSIFPNSAIGLRGIFFS